MLQAQALAGIIDAADGRRLAFCVYVMGAGLSDVPGVLAVSADLSHIAALVQQGAD
jgi:D-alanyl-D-alanine carboxypeptidase